VLYDQRGHGDSEAGPLENNTLEQLGSDLCDVLAQRVPEGPIALVGHSMGGMTIIALAESNPELFGDRIVAVALVGTSSGGMAQVSLGLPALFAGLPGRLLPLAPRAASINRRAERLRASDSDLGRWVNSKVAFGPHVSAAEQATMAHMQAPMRLETMAAFLPTFAEHDRVTALAPLKNIPTLIMVGEYDVLTPPEHSRAIAEALPDAEFVTVSKVGHMTMMEAPAEVSMRLRSLIERALRSVIEKAS
jgi:pimeloyl-ACP methyl ester carboxylesterase